MYIIQYNVTMSNSLTKYRFSGHETFPIRYGWIEKMTDFINNNVIVNAVSHSRRA